MPARSRKGSQTARPRQSAAPLLAAYYTALAVFLAGALLPQIRLWSGSALSDLPVAFQVSWILAGALLPLVIYRLMPARAEKEEHENARGSIFILGGVGIGVLITMILGRGESHLLGDGQALLHNLAKTNPLEKPREFGAEMVVRWLKALVGDNSREGALKTYRALSWGCGALYLAATLYFCHVLGKTLRDRMLLFASIITGGYLLLFYGYVENYAPFILAVSAFCYTGVIIELRGWNRFFILIPLALAIFFHVLGLVLVMPALYVVVRRTPPAIAFTRLSPGTRAISVSLIAILVLVGLLIWSRLDFFVRFAFVPMVADQFTVAGYTLFSVPHLVDMVNLVFLLCPGFIVLGALAVQRGARDSEQSGALTFIGITAGLGLAAAFVLDPKLGMARDWDLFSFVGVPLILFIVIAVSQRRSVSRLLPLALALSAGIGLLVLAQRIVVQASPSAGAAYAERCMIQDLLKSRTSLAALADFYRETGDSASYGRVESLRKNSFPENEMLAEARQLLLGRRFAEARSALAAVGHIDPGNSEYWGGLALYHLQTGHFDSALTASKVADGLNPYSPNILNFIGSAYVGLGKLEEARAAYERSVSIDSNSASTLFRLAGVYRDLGRQEHYLATLQRAATRPEVKPEIVAEACTQLVAHSKINEARELVNRLRDSDSGSRVADSLIKMYPQLRTGDS